MKRRRKNTELEGLPRCAAEFIRRVVRKMRYRRNVRDDVRAELVGHFVDELQDFESGQEKERRVRELVGELGGRKLSRVLWRAKRPGYHGDDGLGDAAPV